jgi:hypothetical protein
MISAPDAPSRFFSTQSRGAARSSGHRTICERISLGVDQLKDNPNDLELLMTSYDCHSIFSNIACDQHLVFCFSHSAQAALWISISAAIGLGSRFCGRRLHFSSGLQGHLQSHDQVHSCIWRRDQWYREGGYRYAVYVFTSQSYQLSRSASSTGLLLKTAGLKVTAIKIDPYMNIDAGTMAPTEHGWLNK